MKAMHHGSHGQIRSVTLDTMVKACALATNNQTANIIDPRDSPEVPVGRSNSGGLYVINWYHEVRSRSPSPQDYQGGFGYLTTYTMRSQTCGSLRQELPRNLFFSRELVITLAVTSKSGTTLFYHAGESF